MISAELLSKVLGYGKLDKVLRPDERCVWYTMRKDPECTVRHINIYELAHKCKEWAYKMNILIIAYKHEFAVAKLSNPKTGERISDSLFSSDTEPEAIFKACEFIRKKR